METTRINVLELFAGVGGFRVGLEKSDSHLYRTLWSNQWEPAKKSQDAFEVYNLHFPDSENINISVDEISDDKFASMDANLIVGGFPCQDYSVARSKKYEKGIEGKKGVLFWQIIRATSIIRPEYLILENVDRLLKSPSAQRGRDFAIMLSAFSNLNYSVEWRVINAAEYGEAQRRRRVFFFVFRNDTAYGKRIDKQFGVHNSETSDWDDHDFDNYIFHEGLFAHQFPVEEQLKYDGKKARHSSVRFPKDTVDVSDHFSGTFWNSGIMRYGRYFTMETQPAQDEISKTRLLDSIVQPTKDVDERFYIDEARLEKFKYLRGPKHIERESANGHKYAYSEGGMSPYDSLALPSRTMLTSEGSTNRSTHLLKIGNHYRLLTPIECERLDDFPDNWTQYKLHNGVKTEVSDSMRYFFMGNALVTGIITRIGNELKRIISEE
jgi:DNA (cytosine-5)-methyltransferase 1